MNPKKKLIVFSLLLVISVTNYLRIIKDIEVKPVGFLSIFAIGAILGLLFQEIIAKLKNR
ncbi:hypothetical protein [Flavobacterium sp.]|uniref:hypothetical protein n=1 Tax=Flavobacterium sp. TaxID=239 RepID=UPI0037521E08